MEIAIEIFMKTETLKRLLMISGKEIENEAKEKLFPPKLFISFFFFFYFFIYVCVAEHRSIGAEQKTNGMEICGKLSTITV